MPVRRNFTEFCSFIYIREPMHANENFHVVIGSDSGIDDSVTALLFFVIFTQSAQVRVVDESGARIDGQYAFASTAIRSGLPVLRFHQKHS